MYDKYPVYDIPQRNIVQRFFSQRWSAIAAEVVLTIVITVAAGRAFEFFDPFDGSEERDQTAVTAEVSPARTSAALEQVKAQGKAYLERGQFAAAEAMYDLVVAGYPSDADSLGWRGYVNLRAGDFGEARRDFRQILEMEPGDYDAHAALCWAYGEQGDFTSALQHCNQAIQAAESLPQYAVALENRCWVKVEMGSHDAATADCLTVLDIFPSCGQEVCALAHYNLGRVLMAQGKETEALRQFNLAFHIGSLYPDMYLDIALVYDRLGYDAAAAASRERYRMLSGGGA